MSEQETEAPAAREWPVVIQLKHPIQFGSKSIPSLSFGKGKLGVLKGVPLDEYPTPNNVLLMASRLCGEPVAALELLDPDDCGEVIRLVMDFFSRCLGPGRSE